ncbi:unnamed protein product [Parajaminaea phylloscopi]
MVDKLSERLRALREHHRTPERQDSSRDATSTSDANSLPDNLNSGLDASFEASPHCNQIEQLLTLTREQLALERRPSSTQPRLDDYQCLVERSQAADPASATLQLEPKARPLVLYNPSHTGNRAVGGDEQVCLNIHADLEDELAAAMAGDVGHLDQDQASFAQSDAASSLKKGIADTFGAVTEWSKHEASDKTPSDALEGDNLKARLAALRQSYNEQSTSPVDADIDSAHMTSGLASTLSESGDIGPVFSTEASSLDDLLPSVPLALPRTVESPAKTSAPHPSLGEGHADIPADRDLDPFRKLVRPDLDVTKLPITSETRQESLFPAVPQLKSREDGDAGSHNIRFCSLCTEDATVRCCPPGFTDNRLSEDLDLCDDEDLNSESLEGCAGDAYCSSCWVEAHSGMGRDELRDHRTKDLPAFSLRRKRGGSASGSGYGRSTPA